MSKELFLEELDKVINSEKAGIAMPSMKPRPIVIVLPVIAFLLCASGLIGTLPATFVAEASQASLAIPAIESSHPYKNNETRSWNIANNSGQNAARIYFSRIELEDGVDKIEIRDSNDTLIQKITTTAPTGLWSDVVPGISIKVTLVTDGSGTFWGFRINELQPVSYTTLGYSHHPYPNNSLLEKTLLNNAPNPSGTRVHFGRVELEDGVDFIIIKDINGNPYEWITGSHPSGFTSKAVPGSALKVQLVTDSSGQAWGYNIAEIQSASPDIPSNAPQRTTLAESVHPYPDTFDQTYTIVNPNVDAVSSKVHFSRINTGSNFWQDRIEILDADDTVIQTFEGNLDLYDVWSDYVPGRIVKVRLVGIDCCPSAYDGGWGFLVDAIIKSIPAPGIIQSNHPYLDAIEETLTLINPDVDAVSSKIHFSRINTGGNFWQDRIEILDVDGTIIQTFEGNLDLYDMWSDYVPGRIVKVRLIGIDCCPTAYDGGWGYRVDAIVNSVPNPGIVQSDHPYPDTIDKVYTITNPDATATASRIHFYRISTGGNADQDRVQVLDADDNVIQTFGGNVDLYDVWSQYIPGRIVKVRLVGISCCPTVYDGGWGFRVDAIESYAVNTRYLYLPLMKR